MGRLLAALLFSAVAAAQEPAPVPSTGAPLLELRATVDGEPVAIESFAVLGIDDAHPWVGTLTPIGATGEPRASARFRVRPGWRLAVAAFDPELGAVEAEVVVGAEPLHTVELAFEGRREQAVLEVHADRLVRLDLCPPGSRIARLTSLRFGVPLTSRGLDNAGDASFRVAAGRYVLEVEGVCATYFDNFDLHTGPTSAVGRRIVDIVAGEEAAERFAAVRGDRYGFPGSGFPGEGRIDELAELCRCARVDPTEVLDGWRRDGPPPLARVTIEWLDEPALPPLRELCTPRRVPITDPSGKFAPCIPVDVLGAGWATPGVQALHSLPPGRYRVRVAGPDLGPFQEVFSVPVANRRGEGDD